MKIVLVFADAIARRTITIAREETGQ